MSFTVQVDHSELFNCSNCSIPSHIPRSCCLILCIASSCKSLKASLAPILTRSIKSRPSRAARVRSLFERNQRHTAGGGESEKRRRRCIDGVLGSWNWISTRGLLAVLILRVIALQTAQSASHYSREILLTAAESEISSPSQPSLDPSLEVSSSPSEKSSSPSSSVLHISSWRSSFSSYS